MEYLTYSQVVIDQHHQFITIHAEGNPRFERIVELAGEKEEQVERGERIELPCVCGTGRLNEVVEP